MNKGLRKALDQVVPGPTIWMPTDKPVEDASVYTVVADLDRVSDARQLVTEAKRVLKPAAVLGLPGQLIVQTKRMSRDGVCEMLKTEGFLLVQSHKRGRLVTAWGKRA